MTRLTNDTRRELLHLLSALDHGAAEFGESNSPDTFFPVPEHLEALRPDVVFVIGPRGAGKTKLAVAFLKEDIRRALARLPGIPPIPDQGTWVEGYPCRSLGPSAPTWQRFVQNNANTPEVVQTLWLGMLVRTLQSHLPEGTRESLAPLLECPGSDAASIHAHARDGFDKIESALDQLESQLAQSDRHIYVVYDELDVLYYTDWSAMLKSIRGLASLWATYYRRWQRLRAKIFLRSDLYAEQLGIMAADVAKMAARRVELHWDAHNLYGMLFKHILNKHQDLREYFSAVLETEQTDLGWIARFGRKQDAKSAVHRLCGEYMGANRNKGHTYTWLVQAIADGAGSVSPRNLVNLVESAARIERPRPRPVGKKQQLLHNVSLRQALTDVSTRHVQQALTNDQPWIKGLRERLNADRKVPWERRSLVKILEKDWEESWSDGNDRPRPPAETPDKLVDRLLRLGVFRERPRSTKYDAAIDVPDLYLEGLGLLRRGGVARK